jgi:hypothetical protein
VKNDVKDRSVGVMPTALDDDERSTPNLLAAVIAAALYALRWSR